MREEIKRAIAIAFRAEGFDEQSREQGFIHQGEIIRDTSERILSLETQDYPEFVIASILETAEVLKRMLDKHAYDSGRRKFYPLKDIEGSEDTLKQVYSYSEIGARIEQRTKTIFTRSAQVRVSVMKPSGKSHTLKVSINLLVGGSSIGVFQCTYKNILQLLEAFDINENDEIFEVCSYYSQP